MVAPHDPFDLHYIALAGVRHLDATTLQEPGDTTLDEVDLTDEKYHVTLKRD